MMFKKWLSIFVAVTLSLGLLAGCAEEETPTNVDNDEQNETETNLETEDQTSEE